MFNETIILQFSCKETNILSVEDLTMSNTDVYWFDKQGKGPMVDLKRLWFWNFDFDKYQKSSGTNKGYKKNSDEIN